MQLCTYLEKVDDNFAKTYFTAMMGDARAAIELCSQPPYGELPEYQEWLEAAQNKLRRQEVPV